MTTPRSLLGLMAFVLGLSVVGILSSSNARPRPLSGAQSSQPPQPKDKKYVGKYMVYPNGPVAVTDVTIAGVRAQINTAVSAGEDWLNGLSFKVKNISNKAISFIYVTVMLPETRGITGGTVMAFDLRHGTDPKPGTTAPTDNLIEPGEEATFVISYLTYQNFKRALEDGVTPIRNINAIQIDIVRVVFEDDTAWATGSFMHRDPSDPRRWVDN